MKALVAIAALIFGFNASAITVNKKCTGLPTQDWDRDAKGKLNYRGQYKGMVINMQINDKKIVVDDKNGYYPGEYDYMAKGEGKFVAAAGGADYLSYYGEIDEPFTWKVSKSLLSAGGSGIVYITTHGGPEGDDYGIFNCEDTP